jgi:RimJ/RimL family protein N-acetyltransferase
MMLRVAYPIETARLLLRPYTEADLEDVLAIESRPDVARYLYWEPRSRAQVQMALLRRFPPPPMDSEGQVLELAMEHREAGVVIGQMLLFLRSLEHRQGELGFVLHPDYQHQGLASEGAREMLRLAFQELELHRVCGRCDRRNRASVAVMERLGMRREAHLVQNEWVKGEWTDEIICAILADQWRGG